MLTFKALGCLALLSSTLAYGQEQDTDEAPPKAIKVVEGQVLTPDGPVNIGKGLFLNPRAVAQTVDFINLAKTDLKVCEQDNKKLVGDLATQVPVGTVVVIAGVSLSVGALVAGLIVGFVKK